MQTISDFGTVVTAFNFQFARLSLAANRDQYLASRKRAAVLGVDFEFAILNLANVADFDAFFVFQTSIGNSFLDDLQKIVSVKVPVHIQFADILDRLRFRVNFFAKRKRAYRAGQFGPFQHDIFQAPFFALDRSRNSGRTSTHDDQIESFQLGAVFEQANFLHPLDDLAALVGCDFNQRQSGHVANDEQAFNGRFVATINDRQNFLRRNGRKVSRLF